MVPTLVSTNWSAQEASPEEVKLPFLYPYSIGSSLNIMLFSGFVRNKFLVDAWQIAGATKSVRLAKSAVAMILFMFNTPSLFYCSLSICTAVVNGAWLNLSQTNTLIITCSVLSGKTIGTDIGPDWLSAGMAMSADTASVKIVPCSVSEYTAAKTFASMPAPLL